MVRRDGADVRRERIHQLVKRVLGLLHEKSEISLSKTVAILEYETGLTREKIMEYLEVGANTGRFVIDLERDKIRKVTEN